MDNLRAMHLLPSRADGGDEAVRTAHQATDKLANGIRALSPSLFPLDRIPGASEAPLGNVFLGAGEPALPPEPPCPVFRGECHPRLGHGPD
jgi:hypothetical protein